MMGRKIYTPEERAAKKREWKDAYAKSERGRRKKAEREATPERQTLDKARYARYRQTNKYLAVQARYAASERGKATEAAYQQWVKAAYPIRVKARGAVAAALRRGEIRKDYFCHRCQATTRLDAHHYLGWEPKHWLTVTWLCRRCHKAAHQ